MDDTPQLTSVFAKRLLPGAAVALAFPVLVPCWVVVLPRLAFDVDPRTPGAEIVTTLGPAGFAWLACFGVLAALLALLVHVAAGGAVRWGSVALVLLGIGTAAWHAPASFENLWHGVGWVWAAYAGLAALHLGQWPTARRWMTLLLAGLAAALLVEAVYYVWIEHPLTVRQFERQGADFLAARGWEPGSSEATLYERRLRTDDATGALGLSNVLGTIAAGLAVLGLGTAAGVVLQSRKDRAGHHGLQPVPHPDDDPTRAARTEVRGTRHRALLATTSGLAVALCGAAVVWLTNSAGALGGMAAGAAWVAAAVGVSRIGKPRLRWLLPVTALGLVALVYVAVLVRGAIGTPTPEQVGHGIVGELSVLFRFHYWQAAWHMVAALRTEQGVLALLPGVGPEGFGRLYLIHKNPLNPEEVNNAHAAFVDYAVMLGVGGLAWAAALLSWLWRGAADVGDNEGNAGCHGLQSVPADVKTTDHAARTEARRTPQSSHRGLIYSVLALALVLFGGEALVAFPEIQGLDMVVMRVLAAGAFVGVAVAWGAWAQGLRRSSGAGGEAVHRGIQLGLVGAAVAVLVHGQFDMAFFQPTSAPILWLIVGLCGAGATRFREPAAVPPDGGGPTGVWSRLQHLLPTFLHARVFTAITLLLAMCVAIWCGWAGSRLHRYQSLASDAAAELRAGELEVATELAGEASQSVGIDRSTLTATVQIPLEHGMEVLYRGDVTRAKLIWITAPEWVLGTVPDHYDSGMPAWVFRLLSQVSEMQARHPYEVDTATPPPDWITASIESNWSMAVDARQWAAIRSPYSLNDAVWLAETNQELGHADIAATCAARALELDAQRYLDPGKQLDDATRQRMREFAGAAE